jgi:hypothetical protein
MGQKYTSISDKLRAFIEMQKIFFVATAGANGRVNASPKGMDSLRVINQNRVMWLNVTGSGNETAAHVQENGRMTLMFCSFDGDPMILRLYGQATVIHPRDERWEALSKQLPQIPGARQVFDLQVDLVQTSCGMSVPFFDYAGEREQLKEWAVKKGEEGIRTYWREKNQFSLDGNPTLILPEK